MSIKSFLTFKNLFGGLSDEQEQSLFAETLYMVLAGAANADLNTERVETTRIAKILKEKLDLEVSHADIKAKAELDLSDRSVITKNVRSASQHLSVPRRQEILDSMTEVFRSDGSIGPLERDYFNQIVAALELDAIDMLKL